jgi:hypothetical protein
MVPLAPEPDLKRRSVHYRYPERQFLFTAKTQRREGWRLGEVVSFEPAHSPTNSSQQSGAGLPGGEVTASRRKRKKTCQTLRSVTAIL